jgi:hypothetical protein
MDKYFIIFFICSLALPILIMMKIIKYYYKSVAADISKHIIKSLKIEYKLLTSKKSINKKNKILKGKKVILITNRYNLISIGEYVGLYNNYVMLRDAKYRELHCGNQFIRMGQSLFIAEPKELFYQDAYD